MSTPYTPPGTDPTGRPKPPQNPPPQPCVVEPPPAVSYDPTIAQKQAHIWREEVIQQRYTIRELERQLDGKP